ncbi:MAG: 3-dehydroquinate synthase [Planctomycetaceae bacterium]|nr:3-dehydroquinate synthase [Planctomycetaceae bacterium]|tara:strand:- start:869 stop:2047 length:1179 start_codon:yes stop_codon:yes gene_type:complete
MTRYVPDDNLLDVSFSAQFVHRVRFTENVLGKDQGTLADLIEDSGGQKPRVQFWLDQHVAEANPHCVRRLRDFSDSFADQFLRIGNVQIIPGGEAIKNDIHLLERMLKVFHVSDLDRRSYVIVLGGGAVLDAVGFAAGIAHRGIRLIRIPSTTLAQADSGMGVKNGVNLFGKKNWVGSFVVPWAVVNDQTLLSTLSDRDYICGFAEAVKVALLKDTSFFEKLEQQAEGIRNRTSSASHLMLRTAAMLHLRHITEGGDPFEMLEARPLDFGHWSAHKLEAMCKFAIRHGEAVACGLAIDTIYSSMKHDLSTAVAERVIRLLTKIGFRFDPLATVDANTLLAGLEEFRQHLGGRLTVTMLDGIGAPIDVHQIDRKAMMAAIEKVSSVAASTRVD